MQRRHFLIAATGSIALATEKKLEESMLASATMAQTPRVGIVGSSFAGGQEHDGTPVRGLAAPQPLDSALPAAKLDAMLGKALSLGTQVGGGLDRVVRPEDWVVLKVRLGASPGRTTDPRLVRGVIEWMMARRRGRRFTIAEAGGAWDETWGGAFDGTSYRQMVQALGKKYPRLRVELVNLSEDGYLEVPANTRTYARGNPDGIYAIPKTIRECDKVVSIAPLVVDDELGVAACIANYRGIGRKPVQGEPEDVLTDLYLHHPADYAIAGGSYAAETNATDIRHNVLIAGGNALSVDAVAAAVMGFDPRTLPLLDRMELRGFGVRDPDSIWTRGNDIDEVRKEFKKPARWGKL
ncbi:MAG: DUF362 domain-containing protein [Bryobacterales bacterium]|nr:DUF362 domain-containing protein [Bryobacterales bacterium]